MASETSFENVDDGRTDGRCMPDYTLSSPIAFGSGELDFITITYFYHLIILWRYSVSARDYLPCVSVCILSFVTESECLFQKKKKKKKKKKNRY